MKETVLKFPKLWGPSVAVMKNARILFILWCLFPLAGFSQIGAKAQQGKISGIWTNNEFGYQMVLMLNTDGTGEFDGETITFSSQDGKLVITRQGTSTTYHTELRDHSLTLSGGDIEKPLTFSRQESSPGSAIPLEGKSATQIRKPVPAELVGKWTGYNETIEFRSDGQCIFHGQTLPFSVLGNQITLQSQSGNVVMPYAITGNQITFTVNGQSFAYAKAGSEGNVATTQAGGSRNLDMTIVGKWCYINVTSTSGGGSSSSECITLKQDGSYEYYSESSRSVSTSDLAGGTASQNSDSGTWWVQGDRIFYQSQTQGQGSYQLGKQNHPKNSDPMIVLDGKAFVTYYNRRPW